MAALVFAVLALCAMLAIVAWIVAWRVPGRIDFALHGERYRRIAAEARQRFLQSGDTTAHYDREGISIDLARTGVDRVTMTLVTADWGHAGKGGYVFSDDALVRIDGDPYGNVAAPGDLWTLEGEVAQQWWVVSNHLQ